ncbi:MAG TPA: YfiR family protein [Bacteroidia bacterium]|jgi:hypothetical protein
MRTIHKYLLAVFAALALGAVSVPKACAQDVDYKAYSLFVYNFVKYIEWPDIQGDFVLGVVGDSPVVKELENMAKTKKAKGHNIVIRKISTPEEAAACQLVYVCSSKSSMVKTLNEKLKGRSVLVVGEREGLAKKGAALSFITLDDDVLKFEINKNVIEQNKLKIPAVLSNLGLPVL